MNDTLKKFINNPYSLDNILALDGFFKNINRGRLYLETEEFLNYGVSDWLIESFATILQISLGFTSKQAKINLNLTNNEKKELIYQQIVLIDDFIRGRIKMTSSLHLYHFYQGLIYRKMNIFFMALRSYSELLDDHIVSMEIDIYIDYLKRLKRSSITLYDILSNANFNNRFDKEIILLYENMNDATREKALIDAPECILKGLSLDSLINSISYIDDKRVAFKLINRNFAVLDESEANSKFMKLCHKLSNSYYLKGKEYLLELRKNLAACPLLDLYLDNLYSSTLLRYSGDSDEAISLDNFYKFFIIQAKAYANFNFEKSILVKKYSLLDICGNVLISLVTYNDEAQAYSYYNIVDTDKGLAINAIVDYANNNLYSFIAEVAEAKKQIDSHDEDLCDKLMLNAFREIEGENLVELTGSLDTNMLVGVEYHFSLNGSFYLLSLRIGNNKTYSVTSPLKFLEAFTNEDVVRYGKELSFKHSLLNLEEVDKEPISYLKSLRPQAIKKNLNLDSVAFMHLISLLKNRAIYFNNEAYIIRLNRVEPRFYLDSSYKLSFDIPYDSIIPGFNNYLALDSKNHYIDLIDSKEKSLINFVNRFKNQSIKRVKKDFIERIYPLYSNLIMVDENIKNEFINASLEINSYFDYEDRAITNTILLKKNDSIVSDSNLNNSDSLKLKRYYQALRAFGFDSENRIINEEDILSFLGADLRKLKELSNVYLSDSLINKKVVKFTPPTIKMSYQNDLMKVFMKDSIYSDEELHQILQAIKKRKKFVLLSNNNIITLDNEESSSFLDAVSSLDLDTKHLSKEETKPIYQSLVAFKGLRNVELDSYLNNMVLDIKNFKKKDYQIPPLNATLRDYQIEGYKWLRVLSGYHLGGILADDMGLGKTLEIITLLSSDYDNKPSLIVTPKSLIFNWISEFNHFTNNLDLIPIYGGVSQREEIIKSIRPNERAFYITSYDSLRNDLDLYSEEFNYIILDEAQYIKNALALTTKAVKKIKSKNRFALTGTPIENDIFDLWSIFDFLMPNYLSSITSFKKGASDESFQEEVKRRVAPFILRRTKEAVLKELPEKFERVISADMTLEQKKLYDAYCLNAKEVLNNGGKEFDVLHLLTRLRQICVDPRTFVDDFKGKGGKLLMLREILLDYIAKGHRVLIFSQFVKALNLVLEELKDLNIKNLILTGDTSGEDRLKYVDTFNNDESYKVFLISLKAGGNGLNLVGADTVIHLDPWWNLASENQATDRAYRMGQTKNVEVIRLIVSQTIEQRVVELQYKKKDLIDKLISNDTKSIEKITLDDMRFILK